MLLRPRVQGEYRPTMTPSPPPEARAMASRPSRPAAPQKAAPKAAPKAAAVPDPVRDGAALVIKSDILSELARGPAQPGELAWPIDPMGLLSLYLYSSVHCRAAHIKAACAYGQGLEFERDQDAARFSSLMEGSSGSLFEDLGLDEQVYGNAFLETPRGSGNRILTLARLPAVTIRRTADGGAVQRIEESAITERVIRFNPGETHHVRVSCPAGFYYAYPSWIGSQGMMDLAKHAISYNRKFFENSAVPEYAIITKGFQLTEAQKQAVRDFFRNDFKGLDNAHRTLYLHLPEAEHSIEFRRVTAESKDADFKQLLIQSRDDLVTAHGVPPRMLGIMAAGALGGGSEITGQLHTFELLTLQPMRERMIAELSPLFADLGIKITADRPEVAFRRLDLTPPDVDANLMFSPLFATLAQLGIMSAEEAREFVGLTGAGPNTAPIVPNLPNPNGTNSPETEAKARAARLAILAKALARS